MILSITPGGAPPAEQVYGQLRGLIATGGLTGGERLPSVRQLAGDLGLAPGTVAKAYRQLEADGLIVTRIGSGTTVSHAAESTPPHVASAARRFVDAARREGLSAADAEQILRAIW